MKKLSIILLLPLLFFAGRANGQNASAERLESIVYDLASDEYKGRGFGSEEGKRAADFIMFNFMEFGVEPFFEGYFQDFGYRTGVLNIKGKNVVGIVKGNNPDLSYQYIIVGAHYDHIGWKLSDGDTVVYNGADDNASGVASVIELGRLLAKEKEKLGRSVILVAFDGEESGLVGSNAFVDDLIQGEDPLINREDIVAMFSLDMVGMSSEHGGIELGGIESLTEYARFIEAASATAPTEIKKIGGGLENRTDTAPFGKIGIPATHVFTGTESPYHKPEDDSDLLDYGGMASIVDFMEALVVEISNAPEVKKTKGMDNIATKGTIRHFNPGVNLNFGGSHFDFKDYYAQAKGIFSYSAGFFLETRISEVIAIQPELLYEWGGSQVATGKLHTHELTVPLSILFTTPDDSGMGVRVYYQIGGYYSYAFGGTEAGAALDFTNDYTNTDYGWIFGVGMEIMKFRIGYQLQSSLIDLSITDTQDTRVKGSFARIGWVF